MADSEIMGIGAMRANFAQLKGDTSTRIARAMVVAAGGVLKRQAKTIAQANGSVRTGAMVKNIAIKREPQAPAGTVEYNLGVRNGPSLTGKQKKSGKYLAVSKGGRVVVKYRDNPYYWKWVEFGHGVTPRVRAGEEQTFEVTSFTVRMKNGTVYTRGRRRGSQGMRARRTRQSARVPAKPFLAPALEQGRAQAIEAMQDRLTKELEKASKA